jgi:hypothetical protein
VLLAASALGLNFVVAGMFAAAVYAVVILRGGALRPPQVGVQKDAAVPLLRAA